ncbi:hypothetical protein MANES_01G253600v8 [Manihot esculenta]|uniref:Uncharacterized protein n=3 Tax=Manihot esculenta TaxID=3983 RepID=A0ACB7IG80_MANES|nr:hypothetical protein MANES_01G253600v8 [Manihot esculenta]KAG8663760.1 hypothetical protein MANES_01G253600v8 [Manihot esculenta]KAG8663761.1 hypothetical protein MANES_01G253600v8 [Manihot esculenta]
MSKPQEPHRPFFSFGNPFRMISPKGSQLSPRLLSLLNAFEETLAERLRKLNPKDKNDILSLTWMKSAMESLCETHTDIKTLITDLELPVTDWDEKWIDVYFDISVKLLDICIAFSSELARLNQGHLLLKCVLHNMESTTSKQFVQARSSLGSWRRHICSKNIRVQNCRAILDNLVESLDLPKVKNSAKGKVLMQAMYGVKTNVNMVIRETFSCGKFTVLKELEAVDTIAEKLYPMIQDELGPVEVEAVQNSVSDLRTGAERLSEGLDFLAKEVDVFFKIVLSGRDALLCNLRASGAVTNPMLGTNVGEQIVR